MRTKTVSQTNAKSPATAKRGETATATGSINSLDIDSFIEAYTDKEQFNINHAPLTWECTADVNCDESLDEFDIDPFVECLIATCPACPPPQ